MKWFLTLSILILVAFVALTTFVNRQAEGFIQNTREVRQKDKDTSENIAAVMRARDELEEFKVEAQKVQTALLSKDALTPYITSQATTHGVTLTIIPKESTTAEQTNSIPLTVTAKAPNRAALTKFLTALESGPVFVSVKKLTLSIAPSTGSVEATIDMIGNVQ